MRHSLKNKNILVTYGPTWVALDNMRVLSNRSSGQMGKLIVTDLLKSGANVTVLEGPIQNPLIEKKVRIKSFTFFDEFTKLFKTELKRKYDIVIHAAAVSDFKPKIKSRTKIDSHKPLRLQLVPTEKLIQQVKRISPETILVGFKLASSSAERTLKKCAADSIAKNHCDLIVANSLKNGYCGFIFNANSQSIAKAKTRASMSKKLTKYLAALY